MTAPTSQMPPVLSEAKLSRLYTLRYLAALTCIAATILIGAFQLNRILEINEQQAEIINVAGAQRMLSQRLALLTPRVIEGRTQSQRDRACSDLAIAVQRMEDGHRFLTEPRTNGPAPAEATPQLRAHYFDPETGTAQLVEAFLQSFQTFVHNPEDTAPNIDYFRVMAETNMLDELDQAVTLYAQAARESTLSAIHTHGSWVAASIVMLLLEVVLIFRPMARNAARTVSKMSAELEERTSTLSRSMQVAKMGHSRGTHETADSLWISRELALLYGLDVDEGWIPLSVVQERDVCDHDLLESNTIHMAFKHTWNTGEASQARGRFRKPDGAIIDIFADTIAQCDSTGKVIAVDAVVRDITDEAEAARQLSKSLKVNESQRRDLVEAQRIGNTANWRQRTDNDQYEWDERTFELLKLSQATFTPALHNVRRLYVDDGFDQVSASQHKAVQTGTRQTVDIQMRRGDGTIIDVRLRTTVEKNEDGQPVALFGTLQDISSEMDAQRELEQLAYFDGLTGLANRTYFGRELARACLEAQSDETDFALLLIDLDHFKEVNDGLGHAAGDELLTILGQRLSEKVDEQHFVGRLGGDEFAIIARGSDAREHLDALCDSVIEVIGESARLTLGEVQVRASIGIAVAPADNTDPDELMRFADLALYTSKENGRGRFSYFKQWMNDSIGQRISLANEVRHALEDGRFEAHFQPLVGTADGKVCGFETLLRLPHPERGFIPPSDFIPIAESSHLIADLGAFVINEACREAKSWVDAGLPPRPVAVNVSAAQIWHGDLEQIIDNALTSTGLDPALLCIELTESVFAAESIKRLKGILTRLNERGISLALDDFGTGYSSLSYLNQLPFDKLKIDRAFVADVDACQSLQKLLQGIVSLGHGLGMEVVAEGVETLAELEIVRKLGCETVQGWYYSKAQKPADAIAEAARIDGLETLSPVRKLIDASAIRQNGKVHAA
ncbi:MAG: hypothetical protein Rhims3KO_26460 [Hyphomicrobiales bacterium]